MLVALETRTARNPRNRRQAGAKFAQLPKSGPKGPQEEAVVPERAHSRVQPLHPQSPRSLHPAAGRPAPALPIVNPQQTELDLKITILTVPM